MTTQKLQEPKADTKPTPEEELKEEEAKINQEAQAAQGEETPASESAPEEIPSEEKEEEELTEEELAQLSAKAQKRFQGLNAKASKAEELAKENAELKQKLSAIPKTEIPPIPLIISEAPKQELPKETKLPWGSEDTGESVELTQEELDNRQRKVAEDTVERKFQVQRIIDQVTADIKVVEEKYPDLNSESESFDEKLMLQVSDWYKLMFRSNPNLRFLDFADQLMSLREKGAEKGKAQVSESLAKQAAEQAVSPSGSPSSSGPKNLEDKIQAASSREELEELEKSLPHA